MRANAKLLAALGIAGLSLAACGSSKSAGTITPLANLPGNDANGVASQSVATTTTTVPANAPVGFNASKSYFVLPHHLGLLPAPELALAEADPAYAAGLANLGDWQLWPTQVLVDPGAYAGLEFTPGAKIKTVDMWYYLGLATSRWLSYRSTTTNHSKKRHICSRVLKMRRGCLLPLDGLRLERE